MPIPLGVLAVAGTGAGPAPIPVANAYEWLATATPTGSQSTISFTNLGVHSATYKHLQVRFTVRCSRAGETTDSLVMTFGGTNSHSAHLLTGNGSSVSCIADTNSPHIYLGEVPSANFTSGAFSAYAVDILDAYSTSKNKVIRSLGGRTGTSNQVMLTSGMFFGSTAAISTITFSSANGGNFTSTSRFSLYGLKG